jgi:hypothetical protein
LGVAATPGFYRIGNFDGLHTSPMVAVRETVPRRTEDISQSLSNDSIIAPAETSGLFQRRANGDLETAEVRIGFDPSTIFATSTVIAASAALLW